MRRSAHRIVPKDPARNFLVSVRLGTQRGRSVSWVECRSQSRESSFLLPDVCTRGWVPASSRSLICRRTIPRLGQVLSRNFHGGPGLHWFRRAAEFFSPSREAPRRGCRRILPPPGEPRAVDGRRNLPAVGRAPSRGTGAEFCRRRRARSRGWPQKPSKPRGEPGAQNGREREASRGP
jgi:hypothetical protein